MTEVMFHFNVPDKRAYACRWLRKAGTHGARVAVVGEASLLQQLDEDLWSLSATDFIAHCRGNGTAAELAGSPVVLCDAPAASPHEDILLNLGEDIPDGFERFQRLVELVDAGEADRAASRRRWKHYLSRGYALTSYDTVTRQTRRFPE